MLMFHNTLSGKKEPFHKEPPAEVTMYTCGPTVYNFAHIGNFRAYIFEDLLRRYLKFKGFKVTQVMNLTDIDDKTIKGSKEKGISLSEYTQPFIEGFFKDLEQLNIEKAEYYPRATEFIPQMVDLVKKLLAKGFAYQKDGSTYFQISKYPEYGKLSKINIDQNLIGSAVDVDEYEKENVRDFVLWKAYKEGEPYWETELGKGRPGWHIECSAMSMHFLGETLDLHTGGEDNIFPHHENEIAQSECATGKPFVRFWMHCAYLLMDTEKMSKSLGNFYTLRDLTSKGFSPRAIRYLLTSVSYRKPLNFSEEGIQQAQAALNRLDDLITRLQTDNSEKIPINPVLEKECQQALESFQEAMDDDLNSSKALAAVFDLVRNLNIQLDQNPLNPTDSNLALDTLKKFDLVFGFLKREEKELLDQEIEKLIQQRQKARQDRDFALADKIRDELKEKGILLKDTKTGVLFKQIS